MAYVIKKMVKGKDYYYIVEGKRDKSKIKQKILYYIGNKEALDKLMKSMQEKLNNTLLK